MTANSGIKRKLRLALRGAPVPSGRDVYFLVVPAVVTFAQLYYLRSAHSYLLYLLPLPVWTAVIPAIPLIASEWLATRFLERVRLGYGTEVRLGLLGRTAAWTAISLLFFLFPITAFGKPDIFAPLIGLWHFVAWILIYASPVYAAASSVLIAALYWLLVYKRGIFRFFVTLALPAAASSGLFVLLYFFPDGGLRALHRPPSTLEKVFPADGYEDPDGGTWPPGPLFPHDIYAAPDDSWVAMSLGATFGQPGGARPGFLWVDLRKPDFVGFYPGVHVRRFSSECADRLYFSPWQEASVSEYRPGERSVRRIALPPESGGWPVKEIFSVYNACGRVYALNNLNPALFSLDGGGRLLKTASLHQSGIVGNGAVVFQVKRNPRRKTLLVSLYGKDPAAKPAFLSLMWHIHGLAAQPGRRIFEFDQDTLELRNAASPVRAFMELVLSPDSSKIYAASVFTRDICVLDADSLDVVEWVKAPFHVRKLEFSVDGKYLFAASYLTGKVLVYSAASMDQLGSFYVTPRPEGMSATAKYLYVAGSGGVFRIPVEKIDDLLRY